MSPCLACGSEHFSEVPYPGVATAARHGFAFSGIAVCENCGLGRVFPSPSQAELDRYYAAGNYWADAPSSPQTSAHARNQCRHRVRRVMEELCGRLSGPILDVGAGEGWIGDLLAPARYDFVEPDPWRREQAARRLVVDGRGFESLSGVGAGYELVFVNQVLEHVAEPHGFLEQIAARLAPGGVLYVEVPCADYRFKPDVFPHTHFFTAAALGRLAEQAGLCTLGCETFGALPAQQSAMRRFMGRVALKLGASASLRALSDAGDDLLFSYAAGSDGVWLRWLGRRI